MACHAHFLNHIFNPRDSVHPPSAPGIQTGDKVNESSDGGHKYLGLVISRAIFVIAHIPLRKPVSRVQLPVSRLLGGGGKGLSVAFCKSSLVMLHLLTLFAPFAV